MKSKDLHKILDLLSTDFQDPIKICSFPSYKKFRSDPAWWIILIEPELVHERFVDNSPGWLIFLRHHMFRFFYGVLSWRRETSFEFWVHPSTAIMMNAERVIAQIEQEPKVLVRLCNNSKVSLKISELVDKRNNEYWGKFK